MDPLALISILISLFGSGLQIHYSKISASLARKQLDLQADRVPDEGEAQGPPVDVATEISRARISWEILLETILFAEVPKQLTSVNISSKSFVTKTIENISEDPSFRERVMRGGVHALDELHNPIDLTIACEHQLGFRDDHLKRYLVNDRHPINITIPINMLAVAAIFFHLSDRFNFQLNYNFPHSISLADRLQSDRSFRPDFCVVGVAPSIHLFSDQRLASAYELAMLMPQCEQRVIAPSLPKQTYSKESISEGTYHVIRDRCSNQLFQEEHLERSALIKKERTRKENCEAHEALSLIKKGDAGTRLIACTPHWQVLVALGLAVPLDHRGNWNYALDSMLFVKRSLRRRRSPKLILAVITAVRDAWYDLQSNPELLRAIIMRMLNDTTYVKELKRACGIVEDVKRFV
jgi:hypothetical protein